MTKVWIKWFEGANRKIKQNMLPVTMTNVPRKDERIKFYHEEQREDVEAIVTGLTWDISGTAPEHVDMYVRILE